MIERFVNLWQRMGVENAPLAATGQSIVTAYEDPSRFYHTRVHLEDVLSKLDWAKPALEKTGEVSHLSPFEKQTLFDRIEMALWYHDVVYDATKKDNEAKSRDLFLGHARAFGLPEDAQKEVAALIDLTAHHKNAKTLAERILTDCDLAILGAPPAEFKKYDKNIRKEYAHVPLPVYKVNRKKVLGGFLNQPEIFKTTAFRDQFETAARRNLKDATLSPLAKLLNKLSF